MKVSRNRIAKLSKSLKIFSIVTLAGLSFNSAYSAVQFSVDGEPSGSYVIHSSATDGFGFTLDNKDYIFDGASALLSSNLSLEQSSANPIHFSLYAADTAGLPTGVSLVNLTSDPITKNSGAAYRFLTPTSVFTLQANHSYVLVPTTSVVWFDYYSWAYTGAAQFGPQDTLWNPLPGTSRSHDGGQTWAMTSNVWLATMIYATPVPEPSSILLFIGVGAAAIWVKRRARQHSGTPGSTLES